VRLWGCGPYGSWDAKAPSDDGAACAKHAVRGVRGKGERRPTERETPGCDASDTHARLRLLLEAYDRCRSVPLLLR
jgi:hypothetical protein